VLLGKSDLVWVGVMVMAVLETVVSSAAVTCWGDDLMEAISERTTLDWRSGTRLGTVRCT